jgi:Icc-related predicted phosphoesterase
MGYYPVVGDEALLHELSDNEAYERMLLAHAIKRCRRWVAYADDRLGEAGVPIVIAPGNDDPPEIDAAFEDSKVFINADQKVVELDGVEVASLGWSNPTPWHTPRECTEEELAERIDRVVGRLRDPGQAVFNFHVPPFDTRLDVCSQLDEEFRVVTMLGNPIPMHAGSTAVREAIERYQPRVGLHGHIHESRNFQRLGQTLALNPGSEYSEGVLQGAVVSMSNGDVSHTFTSG